MRRGNWNHFARGAVLTRPEQPRRSDWADAAIAIAGPHAALSGWDAARVRNLGSVLPPSDQVLVLSRTADNRRLGPVRIRRTSRPYRIWVTPADAHPYPLTPVVHVARAVTDAALQYQDLGSVRALVTASVQRRRCRVSDLLAEWPGVPRNNSRLLRLALADLADGARSAAEAVCSRRLNRSGIPPYQLNVALRDDQGLMILDVYWPELRAALEVDSREYHFSEADWKSTMARHNRLTALGIAVTHYPPSEVMGRSTGWVDQVATWLAERARELGVVPPRGRGPIRPPKTP